MKRTVLLSAAVLLTVLELIACTSLKGIESTTVKEGIPFGSTFYVDEVRVEPQHIMSGISDELPCVIQSCLLNEGYNTTCKEIDANFKLKFFLHRKEWIQNYISFESVTVRISVFSGDRQIAYRIYTEDTSKSIDSFPWIFTLIKKNITDFTKDLSDEK